MTTHKLNPTSASRQAAHNALMKCFELNRRNSERLLKLLRGCKKKPKPHF